MKHKKITYFLIAIALCGALVNVDYFGNPTMAAFFFYVILSATTIGFTGLILAGRNINISKFNYTPVVLIFSLTVYYFLQIFSLSGNVSLAIHVYMVVNCILLIAFIILLNIKIVEALPIYKIIFFVALAESVICLLQFVSILKSNNEFLSVSGSWVNPNVTAIFLAMSLPAVISVIIESKHRNKKLYSIGLLFIVAAILSLRCRTAVIGSIVSTLILLTVHYDFIELIRTKFSLIKRVFFLAIILIITIPVGNYLYKAKQASADGRQLIWKLSFNMISHKPITGIGYGMFEHDYNINQAQYFASNNASENEIANSSFVYMAYNEFLQNLVEGGIIGFILYTAFLLSLLIGIRHYIIMNKSHRNTNIYSVSAHAAIAALVIMSLINFTTQAIPAMILFIIYAAVICSSSKFNQKNMIFPAWVKPSLTSIFLIGAVSILFSQVSLATAYAKTTIAISQSNKNQNSVALESFQLLQPKMQGSDFYYTAYGKALYFQKQYSQALKTFKQSAKYSSSPAIQMQISSCYCKLKQYDSAINTLRFINNMIPNRLTPKYGMMKIYQQINDTPNAQKMAQELVLMQPKGISKKAIFYKLEAEKILKQTINE